MEVQDSEVESQHESPPHKSKKTDSGRTNSWKKFNNSQIPVAGGSNGVPLQSRPKRKTPASKNGNQPRTQTQT